MSYYPTHIFLMLKQKWNQLISHLYDQRLQLPVKQTYHSPTTYIQRFRKIVKNAKLLFIVIFHEFLSFRNGKKPLIKALKSLHKMHGEKISNYSSFTKLALYGIADNILTISVHLQTMLRIYLTPSLQTDGIFNDLRINFFL